ncbi:MAG: hypothetical protein U0168_26235 [Nannocystaceae bacterium]
MRGGLVPPQPVHEQGLARLGRLGVGQHRCGRAQIVVVELAHAAVLRQRAHAGERAPRSGGCSGSSRGVSGPSSARALVRAALEQDLARAQP